MDRTIGSNNLNMDDDLGWGHHVFIDEEGMLIHKTNTYESFEFEYDTSIENKKEYVKNTNTKYKSKGIFNIQLSIPSNVDLYTYMFSFCGFVAINMIFTIGKVVIIKKY
jgi:hypothetical protein